MIRIKQRSLGIKLYLVVTIMHFFNGGLLGDIARSQSEEICEIIEKTKISGFEDITFYCRMPSSWSVENSPVRGVLAFCTWNTEAEDVRKNVSENGRFPGIVKFSDENNLALVSWTNFKGYNVFTDTVDLEDAEKERYDKEYGLRVKEWKTGFKRLCRKTKIPEDNILIYGISGGAQMAHRLVLREPEMFSAIHIHINSSYDVPTPDGSKVLWLVTTGEVEHGYSSAINFYRNSLVMGYHMIFKAGENLGHQNSPEIQGLSYEFFKYCLKFGVFADSDVAKDVSHFELMKYPPYVGDLRNQWAVEVSLAEALIDKSDMVALPTKDLARAWGAIIEK